MERNKIILLGSNDKEDATFKLKYPIKKQMDKMGQCVDAWMEWAKSPMNEWGWSIRCPLYS